LDSGGIRRPGGLHFEQAMNPCLRYGKRWSGSPLPYCQTFLNLRKNLYRGERDTGRPQHLSEDRLVALQQGLRAFSGVNCGVAMQMETDTFLVHLRCQPQHKRLPAAIADIALYLQPSLCVEFRLLPKFKTGVARKAARIVFLVRPG